MKPARRCGVGEVLLVLEEVIELSNHHAYIDLVVGVARVSRRVEIGACAFPIHHSTRGRYE